MGVLERLTKVQAMSPVAMAEEDLAESGDKIGGCKPAMGNNALDRLKMIVVRLEDEERNRDRSVLEIATSSIKYAGSSLPVFVRMGQHLTDVKDEDERDSLDGGFQSYLSDKGMSSGHAQRLMNASRVYDVLEGTSTVLPSSEYQIRSLSGLDPIQMQEAWAMAVKIAAGKQPTSNLVIYAVNHIRFTGSHKNNDKKEPIVIPEVNAVVPTVMTTEVMSTLTTDSTLAQVPDATPLMPTSTSDGTQSQGDPVHGVKTSKRKSTLNRLGELLFKRNRK